MMFSVDFPMFILDEKLIFYIHMNVVLKRNNLEKSARGERWGNCYSRNLPIEFRNRFWWKVIFISVYFFAKENICTKFSTKEGPLKKLIYIFLMWCFFYKMLDISINIQSRLEDMLFIKIYTLLFFLAVYVCKTEMEIYFRNLQYIFLKIIIINLMKVNIFNNLLNAILNKIF